MTVVVSRHEPVLGVVVFPVCSPLDAAAPAELGGRQGHDRNDLAAGARLAGRLLDPLDRDDFVTSYRLSAVDAPGLGVLDACLQLLVVVAADPEVPLSARAAGDHDVDVGLYVAASFDRYATDVEVLLRLAYQGAGIVALLLPLRVVDHIPDRRG